MLILTRKTSESIIVNGDTKVTVLSVKGNQVKIGVDAPNHITVNREEVQDRINRGVPHRQLKRVI